MREVEFTLTAFDQYSEWERQDKKTFKKIIKLLDDAKENPFKGIGKPEPLKHHLKGYWSRRINHEHRLVYRVTTEAIIVIGCKFHY